MLIIKCKCTKFSSQETEQLSGLKKTGPIYMLSRRDSLQIVRTQSERRRIEKYIPCKGEQRKVRAGLTDRWILKQTVKRDKDGCYIMIKGSTQEEDVTFVNFNRLNVRNSNTINSGDFNAPIISVH